MTCPNLPASLPKAVPSLPPLSLYPFPPSTSAASSISPNTGWVANLFPPHWDVQLRSFWLQKRRRRRRRRAVPSDKENTAVLCVLWKRPGPIWELLKWGGGVDSVRSPSPLAVPGWRIPPRASAPDGSSPGAMSWPGHFLSRGLVLIKARANSNAPFFPLSLLLLLFSLFYGPSPL